MKRVLQILFGYIIFCFCVCIAVGFFTGSVPELLEKSVRTYRLYKGLKYFCNILPAVVITGFVIGYAVSFGRNPEGSVMRFSPAMFKRYRHVVIIGLVCSLMLTGAAEIGTPLLGSRQLRLEQMPKLLHEYIRIGTKMYDAGKSELAFQYAQLAVKIDPKSEQAQKLFSKSELELRTSQKKKQTEPVSAGSAGVSEEGYSVSELRKLAEDAYKKGNWFDAHYYAETGIAIASPKNTNIELLRQTAAAAWNNLSQAERPAETEKERIYKKKLEGYKFFMEGDNLKAYYVFRTLSLQSHILSIDPDVVRYLGLATARLNKENFFIDETFNMQEFETANDVYFSIKHTDGSTDIVYIKGITPMLSTDGMIQYLRGLTIFSIDGNGSFVNSMYVQYAKMLEVSVSDFDSETKVSLGIADSTGYVPYILLRSVDRNTEGIVNEPLYSNAPGKTEDESNHLVLPVSYDDIQLLQGVSKGAELMNIVSLFQFVGKTVSYGYSEEVFGQVMLNRMLYPLFILIIFIGFASFAWNYRIGEKLMFKTGWILSFPLFSFFAYYLFMMLQWLYKLLNYVFLGAAGRQNALLLGSGVYIVILIIVSVVFLARNSADAA
jgi:hypothetical protein